VARWPARAGLARSLAAIDPLSGSSDSIFEIASARRSPDSNVLVNVRNLTGAKKKCAEIHPNLTAFVVGGLEPEEAAQIEGHH
jgi:hypothetical protein